MLLINSILFFIGIAFLWKGGDALIEGCIRLAKTFKVSELIIGLTVLSIGTSAPELFVNILASLQNQSDIVVGNILGSNIANILLILGISGVISPFIFPKKASLIDLPISIGVTFLFILMMHVGTPMTLTLTKGAVLLGVMGLYLWLTAKFSKETVLDSDPDPVTPSKMPDWVFILFGIISLPIGAKIVIYSATEIALVMGISQALISVVAIAFATSLPELATSIIAAKKKKPDLVMGNIVGSNIFNIGLILSISACLNPVKVATLFTYELWVVGLISVGLFSFYFIPTFRTLTRSKSILLLLMYAMYIITIIQRG